MGRCLISITGTAPVCRPMRPEHVLGRVHHWHHRQNATASPSIICAHVFSICTMRPRSFHDRLMLLISALVQQLLNTQYEFAIPIDKAGDCLAGLVDLTYLGEDPDGPEEP